MNKIVIRRLEKEDVTPDGDFIRILEQLSSSDNRLDLNALLWSQYEKQSHTHIVVAVANDVMIGTGSILIEQKFLRKGGVVGHLEDIVVDKTTRLTGVGRMIINHLVKIAKYSSCYKVILNCSEYNIPFYDKCGFYCSGYEMRMDLGEDKTYSKQMQDDLEPIEDDD